PARPNVFSRFGPRLVPPSKSRALAPAWLRMLFETTLSSSCLRFKAAAPLSSIKLLVGPDRGRQRKLAHHLRVRARSRSLLQDAPRMSGCNPLPLKLARRSLNGALGLASITTRRSPRSTRTRIVVSLLSWRRPAMIPGKEGLRLRVELEATRPD